MTTRRPIKLSTLRVLQNRVFNFKWTEAHKRLQKASPGFRALLSQRAKDIVSIWSDVVGNTGYRVQGHLHTAMAHAAEFVLVELREIEARLYGEVIR